MAAGLDKEWCLYEVSSSVIRVCSPYYYIIRHGQSYMSYSNQTDILARQGLSKVVRFTPILSLSGLSEKAVER